MTIYITDTDTLTTITLPSDLEWQEEYSWVSTTGNNTYALSGSLIIQQGQRTQGRLITLSSPDDSRGWIERSVLDDVMAFAGTPDKDYQLSLNDDITRVVRFDHSQEPVNARQLFFIDNPPADHVYTVTLRFVQVG